MEKHATTIIQLFVIVFLSSIFGQSYHEEKPNQIIDQPFSFSAAALHTSHTRIKNNYKITATIYNFNNTYSCMVGGAKDNNGEKREIGFQYYRFFSSNYNRSFFAGFESFYIIYEPSPINLNSRSKFNGISFGPNLGYQKSIYRKLFINSQIGFYLFLAQGKSQSQYIADMIGLAILPNLRISIGWIFNYDT
ncbi:MAG: hypothetical protein ACE5D0_10145 [Fidelibacterota bacterium]